jgi:hypothetical protein
MRLPATTYRHDCDQGRRRNNASVSPHCFTAHPVMGGENRHCTHLAEHCTSLVTLEEGYDKVRTPRSQGFGLIRSASTRPRPGLDAQHGSTGKGGRYGTALRVISTSRPLRHHDVQGWPSIPRARRYSHPNRDRQNIISRLPVVLASSRPIKGQARVLQRGEKQGTTGKTQDRDQHLKQSPLSSFFPRRAFFCPNQDKPLCVLLASPSKKRTRSIYSLV